MVRVRSVPTSGASLSGLRSGSGHSADGDAVVGAVGDVERRPFGAEGDGVGATAERQPGLRAAGDRLDDHFGAGVDGAKNVSAWTMEKAGDAAERFALGAFATAWRAKKDEGLISHQWNPFYKTNGNSRQRFPA